MPLKGENFKWRQRTMRLGQTNRGLRTRVLAPFGTGFANANRRFPQVTAILTGEFRIGLLLRCNHGSACLRTPCALASFAARHLPYMRPNWKATAVLSGGPHPYLSQILNQNSSCRMTRASCQLVLAEAIGKRPGDSQKIHSEEFHRGKANGL